jgi:hypothetical protein
MCAYKFMMRYVLITRVAVERRLVLTCGVG